MESTTKQPSFPVPVPSSPKNPLRSSDERVGTREGELQEKVQCWCERLKSAADLTKKRSPSKEPFKYIYTAIEDTKKLRDEVQDYVNSFRSQPNSSSSPFPSGFSFWVKFTLIHIYSSIAKWSEASDELSEAEEEHKL